MSRDIIRWVIDRMMSHEDSITQELALTVEREARAEWGGQRIDYVAKTCAADRDHRRSLQGRTAPDVERRAVAAYLGNEPIDQIVRDHGIHRATLYRMVKR